MIIVTGQPRCGTSMMMYCLKKSGVPMAFKDLKRDSDLKKIFRNPYGFFEGIWNGEEGAIKLLNIKQFHKFGNDARVIVMYRNPEKIMASWDSVMEKKKENFPQSREFRLNRCIKNRETLNSKMDTFNHIVVDYDIFVKNPDVYKDDFNRLLPDLDFDKIKSGIDYKLYKNR